MHLPPPIPYPAVEHARAALSTDAHVCYAYVNPLGSGLEVGVHVSGIQDSYSYQLA